MGSTLTDVMEWYVGGKPAPSDYFTLIGMIIGAIVGISGAITFVYKMLVWMKKSFTEAESAADRSIERVASTLNKAGTTIGGRTDAGFYVMLELGLLRAGLAQARYFSMLSVAASILFSIGSVPGLLAEEKTVLVVVPVIIDIICMVTCLSLGIGFGVMCEIHERRINRYVERIKKLWSDSLKKRLQ